MKRPQTYIECDGSIGHPLCSPGNPAGLSSTHRFDCRNGLLDINAVAVIGRSLLAWQARTDLPDGWKPMIQPVLSGQDGMWVDIAPAPGRPGLSIQDAAKGYARGWLDPFKQEAENFARGIQQLRSMGVDLKRLRLYSDQESTLSAMGLGTKQSVQAQTMDLLLADPLFVNRLPAKYRTMISAQRSDLLWHRNVDSPELVDAIARETMTTVARGYASLLFAGGLSEVPWCLPGHAVFSGTIEDEGGRPFCGVSRQSFQISHYGAYARTTPGATIMGRACMAADALKYQPEWVLHLSMSDDPVALVCDMLRYVPHPISIVFGGTASEMSKVKPIADTLAGMPA